MSESELPIFEAFQRVEWRVGTISSAKFNEAARKPAYVLELDFGPDLGTRTSSAQLTENYEVPALIGRQVVCVFNLPPRRVAGVKSEVLVLAAVDEGGEGTVLLDLERPVPNGTRIA